MSDYPSMPTKLMPSGGEGASSGGASFPGSSDPARTPPRAPVAVGLNRQVFIRNYANMVARTWVDDGYLQLILGSPAEQLAKAGLPTTPGAVIRVLQHKLTGMGKIEDQVDAWIEGLRTGLFDLFLPMKPDDVDVAPGGGGDVSAEGGASCCCSPCCCCT